MNKSIIFALFALVVCVAVDAQPGYKSGYNSHIPIAYNVQSYQPIASYPSGSSSAAAAAAAAASASDARPILVHPGTSYGYNSNYNTNYGSIY